MRKTKNENVDKRSTLNNILRDMRKHEDERINLVEELEGPVSYHERQQYNFYKAYTIVLIEEFCDNDDEIELMLVSYGLLKGFEFDTNNINERINKYWEHSCNYNSFFKNIHTAGSAYKTAYNKTDEIIDKLDKKIAASKVENGGKLKLIDKIPDEWKLPTLRESKNDTIKRISINTSSDRKKLVKVNSIFTKLFTISSVFANATLLRLDSNELDYIDKILSTLIGVQENGSIEEQKKIINKLMKAIGNVAGIFVLFITVSGIGWFYFDSKNTFGQNIESSSQLVRDNALPAINTEMDSDGVVDEPGYTLKDLYSELVLNQEIILRKQARMEGKYYDEKEY